MKHGHSSWLSWCVIVVVLALGAAGCGRSPEKAVKEPRRELAALNLQFTPDDFVQSAGNGDLTAVKLFLDAGMAVDTHGSTSFTALAAAAMRGHLPVVKLLLERGANVNAAPDDGSTPLLHAAEKENLPVLEALMSKGANLNLTNSSGSTALHWAVRRGNTNIVVRLLKRGASTTIQETNGMTAVDCAAEPLLAAGFDPKTSTNAMVVLLRNHGASFATRWMLGMFLVSQGSYLYEILNSTPGQMTDAQFTNITNRMAQSKQWLAGHGYEANDGYWFQSQMAWGIWKHLDKQEFQTSEPERTKALQYQGRLNALIEFLKSGVPASKDYHFPETTDELWKVDAPRK